MIVLDTNVISELMHRSPDRAVVVWLDQQASESIWTTSICVFEIRYGIEIQPDGCKKGRLQEAFALVLDEDLAGRVLEFNTSAAEHAGMIGAALRAGGHRGDMRDVMIAGTVAARRATLATRNTRHFAEAGIALIDPWTARSGGGGGQ